MDEFDTGTIKEKDFIKALKENSKNLRFNKAQIDGIINDAPKNDRNEILYRELNLWIKVIFVRLKCCLNLNRMPQSQKLS